MASRFKNSSGRMPAYLRIASELRAKIKTFQYLPGEFLPSEHALAEEFSVSRQTIRLALDALTTEGFIQAEQGRGTRILDANKKNVEPLDCFNLVALIISGVAGVGSFMTFQGCHAALQQAGYHLIVCETDAESAENAVPPTEHLRTLIDKGIQGILLFATPMDQNLVLLEEALQRNIPIVTIDRHLPELQCDYIGMDNSAMATGMVNHLWQLGHRRIAFLSADNELSTCQELLQGYEAALRQHRAPIDQSLIAYWSSWAPEENQVDRFLRRRLDLPESPNFPFYVNEAVEEHVRTWLGLPDPPTAILAVSDAIACHVIEVARQQGVHVPHDLAVVGIDDLPFAAYMTPPLTTIQQPFRVIGEVATQLLLDRMTGRYRSLPRRVLLPGQMVIRESCGAKKDSVTERLAPRS